MRLNERNEQGFTLVELMVVVAIIGVLSAVAVPNFKKYQAKAKSSEAKVQLAAAYTAQQSFYGDFGIYSTCLSYMGFDPGREIMSRYYAVGFAGAAGTLGLAAAGTGSTSLDTTVLVSAQNSGLGGDCQATAAFPFTASATTAVSNVGSVSNFAAGKTNGGVAAQTTVSAAYNKIGDQAAANQIFVMSAEGTISADKAVIGSTATSNNSVFQINHDKVMQNTRSGY
jgi:type IV pilus assembly protein PilA